MFEKYENTNFHLDFWESCENKTFNIQREIPEGFNKTLAKLNRLSEAFEFEGKWYDSLEDVYHVGSAKEFDNARQFASAVSIDNIKKNYPNDKQDPIDFHIQFIDPKTLKRIAFMIVYESNPFGKGAFGGQKPNCRLILFKSNAYAVERIDTKHKFAFEIKSKEDIKRIKEDPSLRIVWHEKPRKTLDKLKPSEIQREIVMAVSKLNSSGYITVGDDFDSTMERILNATR